MKKISLKEIAFPIDVDVIKKILQSNGIVKIAELPNRDGFYLLDEEGVLIPSKKIVAMVWEQYLGQKIADQIKISNPDGFHIDLKKQLLFLYYLPEDREKIEEIKQKKFQKTVSPNTSYIS